MIFQKCTKTMIPTLALLCKFSGSGDNCSSCSESIGRYWRCLGISDHEVLN